MLLLFQMDASYEPSEMETRTLFGLQMEQKRNNVAINKEVFSNVVSKKQEVNKHKNVCITFSIHVINNTLTHQVITGTAQRHKFYIPVSQLYVYNCVAANDLNS